MSTNIQFATLRCAGRAMTAIVLTVLCLLPQSTCSAGDAAKETWFGWLETPNQHLRIYITTERVNDQWTGAIESPDQAALRLPLSNLNIDSEKNVTFNVENPATPGVKATFSGKRNNENSIAGTFSQSGTSLKLALSKIESIPVENDENPGVGLVWAGNLNAITQKLDVRLRLYVDPPYGTNEEPHVVFDILTQKILGIPVKLDVKSNDKAVFEMPVLQARFEGVFNDEHDEVRGNFIKGQLPLPLTLRLLNPPSKVVANATTNTTEAKPLTAPEPTPAVPAAETSKTAAKTRPMTDAVKPDSKSVDDNTKFYQEPFAVVSVKKRASKRPEFEVAEVKIAGTVTWPILKSDKQSIEDRSSKSLPAIVMVTHDGPQDRNNTFGQHQPYAVLSEFFAERGIVSFRFDDRGTNESTGNFASATSQDFINDAHAVFKHALSVKGIDPHRVGFLGHGEGANISAVIASWESQTAFLILLAPTGQRGAEIRNQQIENLIVSQNLSDEVRDTTLQLQRDLQQLAQELDIDSPELNERVRSIVNSHWKVLKTLAMGDATSDSNPTEEEKIQNQMIANLERQVKSLGSPWMRYYLQFDPRSSWLLIRCPTIALWGEKDTEVIALKNRRSLEECADRNQLANADFDVLPNLNHWFQNAETGRTDEYEQIAEAISSNLLHRIELWLIDRNINSTSKVSK